MAELAAAAMRMVEEAASELEGAAPALMGDAPGALAALLRLSVTEPPLLAGGGPLASDIRIRLAHGRVRIRATQVLAFVAAFGACEQVAALLANSPASVAALGAAIAVTDGERRLLRSRPGAAVVVAQRRSMGAMLLVFLVKGAVGDASCDVSWLRRLAA